MPTQNIQFGVTYKDSLWNLFSISDSTQHIYKQVQKWTYKLNKLNEFNNVIAERNIEATNDGSSYKRKVELRMS